MRTILLSALALGATVSLAMANEPIALSDDQMDKVTAGNGISSLTRGFAVSSMINTYPPTPIRGLSVLSVIVEVPPNPIRSIGDGD